MITLLARGKERGQWWPITKKDGSRGAVFKCRDCGHERFITKQTIGPDGIVNPSVVCACGCGCKFHEFVRLVGWEAADDE